MDIDKRLPGLEEAQAALEEASKMNPGPWVEHSRTVAIACKCIAEHCPDIDEHKAFLLGLLHDIGRRVGVVSERHMLEGYRYCMERGWSDNARVCITHSFIVKDIRSAIGEWDVPKEDFDFVSKYIGDIRYTDYDLLVQFCDSVALHDGCCLLEKRQMDIVRRYGIHPYTVRRYERLLEIKKYFENKIGCSIYSILPNVTEATFGGELLQKAN